MTDLTRVLVVDDDSDVRFMLNRYLSKHGFEVVTAHDGAKMREIIAEESFELVILDLNMPGEDGLSLARYLRGQHDVAIIMLTAAADVVDRVTGLEVGADDYVTKPFEPRELLARIRSVLRRFAGAKASPEPVESGGDQRMAFGEVVLDIEAHRLYAASGDEIAITNMEYDLLKAFADNPGNVLSRDQLLNLAHKRDWDPFDRSIDIRIARLRRKLEKDPSKPRVIKTVRGAGYVFTTDKS